jgi:beta-1,4-N-acetylglucosaminyltransferase
VSGLGRGVIIFIESIARVEHLSLTGKILYKTRVTTLFLVQWEKLAAKLPRARYIDRLM